jgi:cytochrome P450
MVLMPSLTKQFFLQRPSVLTSNDFIVYVCDKYFGDGGATGKLSDEDYKAVHGVLNSLMKEPFLSNATDLAVKLIEQNTPRMVSFSADATKKQHWERHIRAVPAGDHVEVDLFALTMNYIGDIAGEVLMGKAFFENNPNVLDDLLVLDSGFGALLTGAPSVTPGLAKARAARTRLIAVLDEWTHAVTAMINGKDPEYKWRDLSDVSETMLLRVKALQDIKANDRLAAASSVALYWALMVNANKIIFWMLLHIISSTELLASIRTEIAIFAKATTDEAPGLKLDVPGLVKSCPLLKATFFETMRLYTAGTSYKKVLQDVTLTESPEDAATFGKPRSQTYHVAAGNYLVIPHGTMQTDPRLWADPATFDASRFLITGDKGPRADLKHLNPFGGGHSVCKGRAFAEREVLGFIAAFVTMWDFSPVGARWVLPGKSFSGAGSANPIGSMRVRMRRRG